MALKLCRYHKQLTPVTHFYASNQNPDGLFNSCITCTLAYDARYRKWAARKISIRLARKRGRPMKRRPYRSKWNPDGLMPEERT